MKIFRQLLAIAVVSGVLNMAVAANKVLKVASWLPTTHGINSMLWPQVKKEIEARTDGRVSLEVEYGLAPPNGLLELVEYGGADVSWTYHGYFPGRFTTTKMIELPGYEGDSKAASVAHWRAHEKFFKKAGEFDGVELIGLMVHSPAYLFMGKGKSVDSLGALGGRKMRSGGGVANDVAEAVKVSPILAPATKSYEMISGNMADGTFLPIDVIPIFRLFEVAPNAYSIPGGFYRGSFSIFMNENALDGVSDKDKAALQAYFGEELSAYAGSVWDADHDKGLKVQKEHGTVKPMAEADVRAFADMTKSIREKVIKEVNSKGVDGQAAYDFIKSTMKGYQTK